MDFRFWIENRRIDREQAIAIVLDAAGASELPKHDQQIVLASKINEQPRLRKSLAGYHQLKQYIQQIEQYMLTHGSRSLSELVDFLVELNHSMRSSEMPEPSDGDNTF